MTVNGSFKEALRFVLSKEGGYVNDPNDPGGETKWGISKRAYPTLDIKNLTEQQCIDIYLADYWNACGCNGLSPALGAAVFDSAVNCGVSRAIDWRRRCNDDPKVVVELRREYYLDIIRRNPKLQKYEKGWWNRLAELSKLIDVMLAAD